MRIRYRSMPAGRRKHAFIRICFLHLIPFLSTACSTTFEGTLLITTTGSETLTRLESAKLNPLGDHLALPDSVEDAFIKIGDGEETGLEAGARIEVLVEETERVPGVMTRILVNGKERTRSDGRLRVRLRWSVVEERRLPPKEEAVPISLKRGEDLPVDRSVMYVPVPGSRVWGTETKVEIAGPDRMRLKWVSEGPPVDGRVKGRVEIVPGD